MALSKQNLIEMRQEARLQKEGSISTILHDTRADLGALEKSFNTYLEAVDEGRAASANNIRATLVSDIIVLEHALKFLKAKVKSL